MSAVAILQGGSVSGETSAHDATKVGHPQNGLFDEHHHTVVPLPGIWRSQCKSTGRKLDH